MIITILYVYSNYITNMYIYVVFAAPEQTALVAGRAYRLVGGSWFLPLSLIPLKASFVFPGFVAV
jgi:hypothetical protein